MDEQKRTLRRRLMALIQRHVYGMLTCREFENFVLDYTEGQLTGKQRLAFDMHMRMCAECRRYLQQYQRTIEASREAFPSPDEAVPGEMPEALVAAILEARRS